jgi:hypothetical protein
MASGDAQRVWFPEMVETLRSEWHRGMSFEATIELRDELDAMLQRIRSEQHIRSAAKQPRITRLDSLSVSALCTVLLFARSAAR